jgi:hypothetical protein
LSSKEEDLESLAESERSVDSGLPTDSDGTSIDLEHKDRFL